MSFAAEVRAELCRVPLSRRCCAQAEAYGVLLYCHTFTDREIRIVTESEALAARLPLLMKKAFRLSFDQLPEEEGKRSFVITDGAKLAAIADTFGLERRGLAHHINFAVLEESCCRSAFFRGAFLAGGSVTDPRKGYHLELVTPHRSVSREMLALMQEGELSAKETVRKSNYITYFKRSDYIEDLLTAIGAPLSAMEIMNAKLEKNLRGSVNRRVNCDAANLDKAVEAALLQVEAIRALQRRERLEELPQRLQDTAQLRMRYPEYTLTQLAEIHVPPLTKSALNHRLRKLMELGRAQEG